MKEFAPPYLDHGLLIDIELGDSRMGRIRCDDRVRIGQSVMTTRYAVIMKLEQVRHLSMDAA